MAEDTLYTLIDIRKSKKRQRIGDIEETDLSKLSITSQAEYHVIPEPLTSIEINPKIDNEDNSGMYEFDEEVISTFPISTSDQYTSLLILQSRTLILCDTPFAVLSDFEINKTGEVKLTELKVVIDTTANMCLKCCDNSCVHYIAFVHCSDNDHIHPYLPHFANSDKIYVPTKSTIFLIDNNHFHCFYNKEMKWSCDTCLSKCNKSSTLKSFLNKFVFNEPTVEQKEITYPTVSTLPIPLSFDETMVGVYQDQQKCDDLNLPIDLVPEREICEYGHKFISKNNTLERRGIIIYTAKTVFQLAEHKVYSSTCDGPCNCRASFDGNSRLLLNLNNRYFLHYDLLYEYSEFMTSSRNTLHGYLRAKNKVLGRLGNRDHYQYHILQHGWNAYLRMINLDYTSCFTCPVCKDNPEVIVLDGITLGTLKHVPEISNTTDLNQKFNLIPTYDRVFISNSATRNRLKNYCSTGITVASFNEILVSINSREFMDYLLYSSVEIDGRRTVHKDFPGVNVAVNLLSSPSPICGIFQCSLLTKQERKHLILLSKGDYLPTNELQKIFVKLNSVKQLFDSLQFRTNDEGHIAIHNTIAPLLTAILTKINNLFKQPTRQLVEYENHNSYFNYFPALPINYKVPIYDVEKEGTGSKCSKIYPKHNRFSPGMLVMACKHKVCYGFEILRERESTIVVYNMLISIFKKPPKIIIYDNACNLHTTCLMRDPALFRDTTFLVDRFHFVNHKCSRSYSMKYIQTEDVKLINSQVCEQIFSVLRRISTQISYMRIENVFFNTRYFLAILNQQIQYQINKE